MGGIDVEFDQSTSIDVLYLLKSDLMMASNEAGLLILESGG